MHRSYLMPAGAAALALAVQSAGSASLDRAVVMPELSEAGSRGQAAFGQLCAGCHGADAGGTGSGPPPIHSHYHPNHHNDAAIARAVRQGAHAHHWSFGDMPPVAGIGDAGIADIIAFIREVQKANGIF
jgi:mono/diheme cytochrome c family protein